MRLGIVGHEAAKFTPETEAKARGAIRALILRDVDTVISGQCHLGGIDIWAVEEARRRGLAVVEHAPRSHDWTNGYKPRNLLIAQDSDAVVCLVVQKLPPGYTGMRFKLCYHCGTTDHVKSGGCWTVKQAKLLGKPGEVIVIEEGP